MVLQAPKRIAVIDDDATFVQLMVDLLTDGDGYDVVGSDDSTDGLAFVKTTGADLVILDLMTGREETGSAILERLRADPETAGVPIIVCSAASVALQQSAARLIHEPTIATVAKPFDVDDLLATIARLLGSED